MQRLKGVQNPRSNNYDSVQPKQHGQLSYCDTRAQGPQLQDSTSVYQTNEGHPQQQQHAMHFMGGNGGVQGGCRKMCTLHTCTLCKG